MGCAQARPKTLQQRLIDQDLKLHFSDLDAHKIKQNFGPLLETSDHISYRQFRSTMLGLGIQYSLGEERMIKAFLSAFFSHEEEGVIYYNLNSLLVVMFLLCNDKQQNKAEALFDLYDDDEKGLSREKIEKAIQEIVELVQSYTKRLLESNSGMIQLQESASRTKRESLLPQVVNWFCPPSGNLTKGMFLSEVKRTSTTDRGLLDFTSPQSIRNAFMIFTLQTKQMNIELQAMPSMSLYSSRASSFSRRELQPTGLRDSVTLNFDTNMEG